MCDLCEIAELGKVEPEKAMAKLCAYNLMIDAKYLADTDKEANLEDALKYGALKQSILKLAQLIAADALVNKGTIH